MKTTSRLALAALVGLAVGVLSALLARAFGIDAVLAGAVAGGVASGVVELVLRRTGGNSVKHSGD